MTDEERTLDAVARSAHTLRWTFRRAEQAMVCELGLNSDNSAYELRFGPSWSGAKAGSERFDDALSAFQRHAAIERTLVVEGWHLESFETGRGQ